MKLEIKELTKHIGSTEGLKDISLTAESGQVVGLAGVNGSGKTMLMRAILGLMRPSSGGVWIDGKLLGIEIQVPPSVGFLLEGPAFLDTRTGLDNLALIAALKGKADREHLRELLHTVGLDPDDHRRYRKYSLGMKQRLGIAAAVMGSPDLIVLDELTNALDTSGVEMVAELVRRERDRGAALVIASHDPRILTTLSDELYHLAEGHLDGHEVLKGSDSHGEQ
ncbi:ATP-binding cassette domain-containing protein [Collinsella sp. AGMB00827]|uniref:ATP-binding cassette domain-containing protein n=1 Tax=Collinsella ureilytica TaxID=2869515 RepID=A0ABS7MJH7_9ACTN|nr:ATP-binding cassette domain-containing protein [Collinsella urealyticum]MBY4797509.1 ATP-binding cassette domain-containing protein [Collinsella urealyticum]